MVVEIRNVAKPNVRCGHTLGQKHASGAALGTSADCRTSDAIADGYDCGLVPPRHLIAAPASTLMAAALGGFADVRMSEVLRADVDS
jgi:hypothetical protein